MHRTWMWTAAALGLVAGVTVLLIVESRAGPPPAAPAATDNQPAVRLSAPTRTEPAGPPREPQANLLRPVPALPAGPEAAAGPGRRVTVARWPLPETPPPALADAEAVRPMPARAAAPRPPRPVRPLPITGTYPARLDDAGGLALPAELRQQLKGQAGRVLFVAPGPDACLYLYTADGLRQWSDQFDQAGGTAARRRDARRLSLAQTEACAVDRSGRLRLPPRLARFAGLRQDVVLLGGGDHLEAWDAGRWRQYRQQVGAAGAEEACEP